MDGEALRLEQSEESQLECHGDGLAQGETEGVGGGEGIDEGFKPDITLADGETIDVEGAALQAQVIHQRANLVSHPPHGVGPGRSGTLPMTKQIVGNHREMFGQRHLLPLPHLSVQPQAVNEYKRRTFAPDIESRARQLLISALQCHFPPPAPRFQPLNSGMTFSLNSLTLFITCSCGMHGKFDQT